MSELTCAEKEPSADNDMILTTKRSVPLPLFKGNAEKLFFCQETRSEGPSVYAIAVEREVTVSSGSGRLLLRHDVPFDIRQLLHVVFPPSKVEDETNRTQEYFCLIGMRDMLFIALNDCHPLGFRVQFDIHAVYTTKFGLLVERELSTQKTTSTEEQVVLYSLSHPLNELLAVIFKPRDSLTQWLFCWEKSQYAIIGAEDDFLLVFDRTNKAHSLLRIRITSEHEVRSAIDLFEKRRTEVASRQATPNLENLKSTPLTTHRLQGSGASVASQRLQARPSAAAPGGSLIRSVHTRSMTARLANKRSFPHPPHAPPADSPALSIFSPMSLGGRSDFANSTISQPCAPPCQGITPRIQVFSRELQRQPDFDLLLAELCLDHVWTEPLKRDLNGEIANKMFLSRNVLSQNFVNFFINPLGQLRSIRVVHTMSNITTSGSMFSLQCRDATPIRGGDLIAILGLDNSISFYSGHAKCAVAVIPRFSILPSMLLHPTDNNSFVIQCGSQLTRIHLPPMFVNPRANELFAALVEALPREKALHLLLEWKTYSRNHDGELELCVAEPQLHSALRFVLEQIGIVIEQHPRLPWRKIPFDERCEVDAKQRRPKASPDENWSRLLTFRECTTTLLSRDVPKKATVEVNVNIEAAAPLHGHVYAVVGAIHGLFEEWSLDYGLFHLKSQIVYYLHALTSVLGLTAYSSRYAAEFTDCANCSYHVQRRDGLAVDEFPSPYAHSTRNFSLENPFSLWKAVSGILHPHMMQSLAGISSKIARMLTVLGVGLKAGRLAIMADVHRLLGRNWERRLRLEPSQVEKVAQIMFSTTKSSAQKSASLVLDFGFTRWTIEQLPPSIGLLLGSVIVGQHTSTELFQFKRPQTTTAFPQSEEMSQISRIRWPRDVRRDNVRAMLDSTKPVLIATQHLDAGTDGEIREAQEQFLSATWTRYLSQAFGRAFFELRTVLPSPTEPLFVPDLCLSARVYPSNLTYDLTLTESLKQMREWGEFYNGVAAGLRVVGDDVTKLDHEWLTLCHSNDKISPPTAAGLLYAFGLNGHLPNFNTFHVHEVLATLDKFPSIALLLGMAMAKIGSGDRQVHKMLTTHLPFLMGPTMLNLKIDPLIQTSALSGLGILFAQTGHTNVVNKLLNEIGKSLRADEEPSPELPAYKLSAGFAIGLICLGLGDEIAAARPPFKQPLPSIPDRLLALMLGGPRNQCVFIHPQMMTCPEAQAACSTPPQESRSNHVREGPNVNVHMTAHPATIALGLMYMRTGNAAIAKQLELPETISMLEEIRPDLIFVRVLARSLVLWDQIEPTAAWIDAQIPPIIHKYALCVLKFPSSTEKEITEKEQAYWDEVVDKETVAEVYLYAMSGACFAMALKYSGAFVGTYDSVSMLLKERLLFVMHDFNIENLDWPAKHLIRAASRSVVNLCADMLLTSMGILNVGRGDVDTIRFARYRRSHDYELSYWSHYLWKYHEEMSLHRALAMLFLGEGRYGFKRDNLSIALLVISMYPIVAHHVADNRLYHQPLRFLWTYAVEPRLLVPMCRKKDKPIQCDIEIMFKNPSDYSYKGTAPMVLPPIEDIKSIALRGAGVEEICYDLTNADRKRELIEILTSDHGRIPISVTENCLDDQELAQQEDWTLRQIFDHRVERPSCKVTRLAKELERMKMPSHPGESADLRWRSIDSAPAVRQYLKTLNMEINRSPASLSSFVACDVKLASCVAEYAGNMSLANRLDIEAQRLEREKEA